MSSDWIRVLALISVFAAVLLAVEVLVTAVSTSRSKGRAINLRLRMINSGRSREETLNLLRRRDNSVPDTLPAWLIGPARRFEKMVMAAGITTATSQLMIGLLLAPFVLLGIMVLVLLALGSPMNMGRLLLLATISGLVGLALPLYVLSFRATRMRKKMEEQFPVALDVFVRGLRAGHPVAAALDLLTVEMPDPIGSQFGLVVDEVTYGADLRDALHNMAERWDLDDMRMFVVSLAVQSETGGNLAEILENLSKVIRDRASMMMKVRALSSEGRMTSYMLTALPILTFLLLFTANPRFFLDVADSRAFVPGFVGLAVLYTIGFVMIRRMVDLKV
ncbi:type II secretion system F family protein [Sphingomonas ginkgonis]|uniref:Type II secretion system F family protein n=1 Tax=Sphingomonas ginkgonis TaxID=2315330 RepID=A0A3R9X655_9SPHN|nr:type II secretion system F family protein [Sphingomonas ginkgonis]RST29693.1 type II secretion system F family protein [Sphingomonas ginkgonis]